MRDSHTGAMPRSTLRNAMNGKSLVASEVSVSFCSTSRACGPATVRPTMESASTSKRIGRALGEVRQEPARVVHLGGLRAEQEELVGPMRLTENSPSMRPCGLSIAVRLVRPTLGRALVNSPCSHSAAPGR
jgi:hypothetical protein